jgi:hypothetical protein
VLMQLSKYGIPVLYLLSTPCQDRTILVD